MHHAVTKARRTDLAPLRFVNVKVDVAARSIAVCLQIVLELEQAIGKLIFEDRRCSTAALSPRRLAIGLQQVFPVADAAISFTRALARRASISSCR